MRHSKDELSYRIRLMTKFLQAELDRSRVIGDKPSLLNRETIQDRLEEINERLTAGMEEAAGRGHVEQ